MSPVQSAQLEVAERALADAIGSKVRLSVAREFRPGRVARCFVQGAGLESVVVKTAEMDRAGVADEHAALELLGRIAPSSAARLLAADAAHGVLVLEDLGDGPSLATMLLGGDPQVARTALVSHASALGRLHAVTIGRAEEFYEIRRALGPVDPAAVRMTLRSVDMTGPFRELSTFLADNDLPPLGRAGTEELAVVQQVLADPGGFLALSSGDPCPDNGRITVDGVRFFDFEAAGFRHALVDAAHYLMPFPNCWCWRVLPPDVANAARSAYRESLAVGCAEARQHQRVGDQMATAAAAWLVWTLYRRLPQANDDPVAQSRVATAVSAFLLATSESHALNELRSWAAELHRSLATRWHPPPPDTYPAFGGPPFLHRQ